MLENTPSILLEVPELLILISDQTKAQNLRIVNANYPMQLPAYTAYNPAVQSNHIFEKERIPKARHIDLSSIGDKSEGLPAMLPLPEAFSELMNRLNIELNNQIVLYGDDNLIGPSRAYWMFKVYGFPNVFILNGTFSSWKEQGGEVEVGEETWKNETQNSSNKQLEYKIHRNLRTKLSYIQQIVKDQNAENLLQLFDTRKAAVFKGDPKNLRSGHIPGFVNIPFVDLLGEHGRFKEANKIREVLEKKNYSNDKTTILSCNSGMTASVLYVALTILNQDKQLSLYDGSWTEWIKYEENPIVQGE